MTSIKVSVTPLPHAKDLALPAYATEHAAGMDLCARCDRGNRTQAG